MNSITDENSDTINPEPEINYPEKKPVSSWKDSILFKVGSIGFLILLLLIPLGMIDSLLGERLSRRDSTITEITSTWGKEQTIVGPVLIIPYRYFYKTWVEETVKKGSQEIQQRKEVIENKIINAYFLPTQLNISGDLKPDKLHRGIYDAIVYTGNLKIAGQFNKIDFSAFKIADNDILWDDATISFALTDLRGTHETLLLEANKQKLALIPGGLVPNFVSGVQTNVKGLLNQTKRDLNVNLNLVLNGSSGLQIAPIGIQNNVALNSSWQDPNFNGAFLPMQRDISAQGFKAQWQISYYGRNYPQLWSETFNNGAFTLESVNSSLFGVTLVSPIDSYRNVERSIKYGVLFVTLVFTAFFLFEVSGKIKIHPFQYLLVGAALCLFYLTLLSLSEFIAFILAYILAASASTVLITLYSMAVLKSGQRGLLMAGGLITTYGFLYITLQVTDYALLIGTVGLFMALSLVMYATRDIDWYMQRS
jgi:inner membrane protein